MVSVMQNGEDVYIPEKVLLALVHSLGQIASPEPPKSNQSWLDQAQKMNTEQ